MNVLPGEYAPWITRVISGDRVGSVTVDFIVPQATPILSDRLVAGEAERRVLPLARRSFDAANTLHCWIELLGASSDSEGQVHATASFVARSRDGREWAASPAVAMNVEGGHVTRLLSVPLRDAPLGEQELVVVVRDAVSGTAFEAREPFTVEPGVATGSRVLSGAAIDSAQFAASRPKRMSAARRGGTPRALRFSAVWQDLLRQPLDLRPCGFG